MNQISDELMQYCRKLSHRFKSQQEYEDLVMEGYLGGLEAIRDEEERSVVFGKARTAMSKYMTSLTSPVDIPYHSATRRARAVIRQGGDLSGFSQSLIGALCSTQEPVEANTLKSETDTEEDYINTELFNNLHFIVHFWLTEEESELIYLLYFEGLTEADVAKSKGVSPTTVNTRKTEVLKKLRKYLTQNEGDKEDV